MKFTISRVSHGRESTRLGLLPCDIAYWEYVINTRCEKRLRPVVNIMSIDELLALAVGNGGRVVVSGPEELDTLPHVEIYDDWRE